MDRSLSTKIPMAARRCEQCENCYKHVHSPHCVQAVKNCNKRHTETLMTCAKCKEVRYCSRACQKSHWADHKLICESQHLILLTLRLLGPEIETAFNSFAKFSKNISGYLEKPAISALELWRDRGRVDHHVFLLLVRGKKTIFPNGSTKNGYRGCYTYKILTAQGMSMQAMHKLLDYRSGPYATPAVTERALAHRPGLLRIFVMETSGDIPPPLDGYTLPTDISNWPKDYHEQYDKDWLIHFLEDVGQPVVEPGPAIEVGGSGSGFFAEGEFQGGSGDDDDGMNPALSIPLLVPPARPSSPVDPRPSTPVDARPSSPVDKIED